MPQFAFSLPLALACGCFMQLQSFRDLHTPQKDMDPSASWFLVTGEEEGLTTNLKLLSRFDSLFRFWVFSFRKKSGMIMLMQFLCMCIYLRRNF